ncbi:MAG: cysteine desulfurase family protein [Limnochordia bacterium]|jgi:cysteine desulfurase
MPHWIYLDNASTTKATPEVCRAIHESLATAYGNPSSPHTMGLVAEERVRDARRTLASYLGVPERGLVFTSGGTESVNLAVLGVAEAHQRQGKHIIISAVEHAAVLAACKALEDRGWHITQVGVDRYGRVSPEDVEEAIGEETVLVSIMTVNNEVGSVQPIADIATAVRARNPECLIHTDAVQALGKIDMRPVVRSVDLLSVSAHKVHGPKGCGALWIREGIRLRPMLVGGGQERGLRSGTENVPGIVGFAAAVQRLMASGEEGIERMAQLRSRLVESVTRALPDAVINGPPPNEAAPHICNISIPGMQAEIMVRALAQEGVFVSTGAACSSRRNDTRVLKAMGIAEAVRSASMRFSLSPLTTEEELDTAVSKLCKVVELLRPRR